MSSPSAAAAAAADGRKTLGEQRCVETGLEKKFTPIPPLRPPKGILFSSQQKVGNEKVETYDAVPTQTEERECLWVKKLEESMATLAEKDRIIAGMAIGLQTVNETKKTFIKEMIAARKEATDLANRMADITVLMCNIRK